MRMTKEVMIGNLVYDEQFGVCYELGQTESGMCYKDLSAWNNGNGIIYIPESEGINYGGFITINDVDGICSWTKKEWLEYVTDVMHDRLDCSKFDDALFEKVRDYIAFYVLCRCDWQDLSTYIEEWEFEECINDIVKLIKK